MASSDPKAAAKSGKNKGVSQEQVYMGFQEMRNQQRQIAGKISELQMERKEHDLVIDTLKEIDGERKCFRMVGGVLVERTVKEVLPALKSNYEQLGKVVDTLTAQLETKGKELNEYREKHNIRMRGEDENGPDVSQEKESKTTGVLVAQDAS